MSARITLTITRAASIQALKREQLWPGQYFFPSGTIDAGDGSATVTYPGACCAVGAVLRGAGYRLRGWLCDRRAKARPRPTRRVTPHTLNARRASPLNKPPVLFLVVLRKGEWLRTVTRHFSRFLAPAK